MKRILITGENSYIGGKFTEWVAQWPDKYHVDEISVRDDKWKQPNLNYIPNINQMGISLLLFKK